MLNVNAKTGDFRRQLLEIYLISISKLCGILLLISAKDEADYNNTINYARVTSLALLDIG